MKRVPQGEVTEYVETFMRSSDNETLMSRRRERSWDFCFNHFQDHPLPTEAMELSCLHLGYYLASWGMLRGSNFLFRETNLRHFQRVVEVIEEHNPHLAGVDADRYRESSVTAAIGAAWADLKQALLPEGNSDITLISKVMMGVWGCLPSYDTYFKKTFYALADTRKERGDFSTPSRSLHLLGDFYNEHAQEIEILRPRFPTIGFMSGAVTDRLMTRAKIIDTFGYQRAAAPRA